MIALVSGSISAVIFPEILLGVRFLVVEAITLPLLSNLLSVPLIISKSKLSTMFCGIISVITTSVKSTVSTSSGRMLS